MTLVLATPSASSASAGTSSCRDRLVPYERGWLATPTIRIELATEDGRLLYLGAEHTRSPAHTQFERWREEFDAFEPTVVLYEGHDGRTAATPEASVREFGESGFVRWLAREAGLRARSMEPSIAREIQHLRGKFSDEKVQLHYVLREVMLLRSRTGATEPRVREKVGRILKGLTLRQIPRVLTSIDELEQAFRRYWPYPQAWWDPPAAWFNPLSAPGRTGGAFTNQIERAAAAFRDRFMFEQITGEVTNGERVFAVVGRGHLPMQAPALRCALTSSP